MQATGPHRRGDILWLLTSGEPKRVRVMRQVLFGQPAYRVRLDSGESACVDGIYLSIRRPANHRNAFHGWGGAGHGPRRDDGSDHIGSDPD